MNGNDTSKQTVQAINLVKFDSKLNCPNWKSNLKWTLKRLSRDPNLHMALLTAAALRKKTALSLQDRKNPLPKLLPFVSKVKRKAESSIFFFTFRHVQHSLQRGHIALFFFHKCPTEPSGGQFLGCPSFWIRLDQICPKGIKHWAIFFHKCPIEFSGG